MKTFRFVINALLRAIVQADMKQILLALITLLMAGQATAQMTVRLGPDAPLRKLQIAEMAINGLYVDSVNEQKLVEDAIRGMIEKLDPHSSYMTAKEVKEANEPLRGNFEGLACSSIWWKTRCSSSSP